MATFTLVVRPDGKAILTTSQELTKTAREHLMETIGRWEHGQYPMVVIPDCDVVQVVEIELDLEPVQVSA
jgi:hypothetical protein